MRIFRAGLLFLGLCILTNAGRAFTQEVYVWQRQLTPGVYESVDAVREKVDGIAVLAAEVRWVGKEPTLFKSSINGARLAATGRPISLVFRIGPYAGVFARDDGAANYLAETAAAIMQTAKAKGLKPVELQVDFDCASSKLAGYCEWLSVLRVAVAPARLVFTALPDWLAQKDFRSLARAAEGYVLQVHSLEKPASIDAKFQLCDPVRSWTWIEKAALLGVSFRVALPTYGYRLAFDRSGKFIALAAEGVAPSWPEGTQVRFVRANADAISVLATKLAAQKPANCEGIIWFRLPVPDDELNWDLITLKAVLGGRIPASQLTLETKWTAPGLAEVSLVNAGERDETLPAKILTRWTGDEPPQTMDGLGGYSAGLDSRQRDSIVLTSSPAATGRIITPGRTRKVGWLHFNHETALYSEILATP